MRFWLHNSIIQYILASSEVILLSRLHREKKVSCISWPTVLPTTLEIATNCISDSSLWDHYKVHLEVHFFFHTMPGRSGLPLLALCGHLGVVRSLLPGGPGGLVGVLGVSGLVGGPGGLVGTLGVSGWVGGLVWLVGSRFPACLMVGAKITGGDRW